MKIRALHSRTVADSVERLEGRVEFSVLKAWMFFPRDSQLDDVRADFYSQDRPTYSRSRRSRNRWRGGSRSFRCIRLRKAN